MIKKNIMLLFTFIVIIISYNHILNEKNKINDSISFEVNTSLPIITATLNGVEGKFLLDTGASISILNYESIDDYNFIVFPYSNKTVTGLGGSKYLFDVTKTQMMYNNKIIPINFKCTDITKLSNTLNIIGVIGSDFLIVNDLVIDYKNKILRKSGTFD